LRIGIYTEEYVQESGGAYTFLQTIIQDIVSSNCKHDFFIFFNDSNAPERYNKNKITYINRSVKEKKGQNLLFRLKRKFFRIFLNKHLVIPTDDIYQNENIDLLWILGPYSVDTTIPFIFTVWDLGHIIFPFFPEYKGNDWDNREKIFNKMLKKATYIITGNQTGKNEIIVNYSINPDKIHVIPFPIPAFCFKDTNKDYFSSIKIKHPFIFYPAQFWAHKNHIIIIEAIKWLRDEKEIVINCYFTGHDYGNMAHVSNMINKYNLNNQIIILGFIPQEDLIYLYKNALAMVYPSILGPNNLPLLEAVAFRCPLIYSNIPGHIEQMEGAGLPFDLTNNIALGENIFKIYSDSKFREDILYNEQIFFEKYKSFSYFNKMKEILNMFYPFFRTWNE
jgi:glycosyltransferase involved in cell wall biosynthesis